MVVLGDPDELERPLADGEHVTGNWRLRREGAALALVPSTPLAFASSFIARLRRENIGLIGVVIFAVFFGFLWWAFAIMFAARLVSIVRERGLLTFTASGVRGVLGEQPVDANGAVRLKAKLSATRGTQSKKRKLKATLRVTGDDGVEHQVRFDDTEALLRFVNALRSELGVNVKEDFKIDGDAVDD